MNRVYVCEATGGYRAALGSYNGPHGPWGAIYATRDKAASSVLPGRSMEPVAPGIKWVHVQLPDRKAWVSLVREH